MASVVAGVLVWSGIASTQVLTCIC